MSQYTLDELAQIRFVAGWDAQLNTFFVQGWMHPGEFDAPLFACGQEMGEIENVSLLVEYVEHYGISIPSELLKKLEKDKSENPAGEITNEAKDFLERLARIHT